MSGICGLFNLDGAPVAEIDIRSMCAMLVQRAPDGMNVWYDGAAALGHTLLITTPEAEQEQMPFRHAESGCVITADIRLDNRDELLAALAPERNSEIIGDAELVLLAYLTWNKQCPRRLLGDFAFAIWDPREQHLFCARDHYGMRPLYYHHAPGKRFVLGSSAQSILVLPQVPYQINEARVADYLIQELEWVDYTCTFFEDVFRLPPGYIAIAGKGRVDISAYWRPDPGTDPGPMSDDDWREGLLEELTRSVDVRLRAPVGQVGSMLSGGMDSGSVVAVAKALLAQRGEGSLPTFSLVCGSEEAAHVTDCAESQAIYSSIKLPDIQPTLIEPVSVAQDAQLMLRGYEEPFDIGFMFLKKIYAVAAQQNIRVVLDGGGGDVIFGEGSYLSRLIRAGKLKHALTEIRAENDYFGGNKLFNILLRYARAALLPESVKQPARRVLNSRAAIRSINGSLVSTELADRVDLPDRFRRMRETFANDNSGDYATETIRAVMPNMTAGKERYARLAASCATESRDPFMDKRLIEFCAHIPGHLRIQEYQHKLILRQIMDSKVPHEVAWAGRKPHIGWLFNQAVKKEQRTVGTLGPEALATSLRDWVNRSNLVRSWQEYEKYGYDENINTAMCLDEWLGAHKTRPTACN